MALSSADGAPSASDIAVTDKMASHIEGTLFKMLWPLFPVAN
jgi:hypothetical protein